MWLEIESREAIVPDVWSSGFSRRASYSHLVFVDPNSAFVFARDTPGDAAFRARLAELAGTATEQQIGVYHVYTDVTPLDRMRRP